MLITDNGPFAHHILSPKNHIPKTYRAVLAHPVDEAAVQGTFARGLILENGEACLPAGFRVLEHGETPLVEIILYEGMYHQVKRMFLQVSNRVLQLRRTQIGALPLDPALAPGEAKEIMHKELTLISPDFIR